MINETFIRTFVELAKEKHFTRTARKLHMTQPGVSQHLKKLEEHFGVKLIDRDRSEVVLTEAGRTLLQFGQDLEQRHHELKERLILDSPHRGRVRMSSPGSWGLLIFDVMMECTQKHPLLRVDLVASPSVEIPKRILNDEIDVGYATVSSPDPRLKCTPYVREELYLVVPANFNGKTFQDLQDLGLVWHPDVPYLLERIMENNFPQYLGIDQLPIRCSINQMNRILDPIEKGLGFSILPRLSVDYYGSKRKVKIFKMKHRVFEQLYRIVIKRRKLPARVLYVEEELQKSVNDMNKEYKKLKK